MSKRAPYFQYLKNSDLSVPSSTISDRKERDANTLQSFEMQEQERHNHQLQHMQTLNPSPMEIDEVDEDPRRHFNSFDNHEIQANGFSENNNVQGDNFLHNDMHMTHGQVDLYSNEGQEEIIVPGCMEHDIEDLEDDIFEDAIDFMEQQIHVTISQNGENSEDQHYDDFENEDAQPIYPGAALTKQQSNLLTLCYIVRHHVTDYGLDDLMDLLNCHLPEPIYTSRYQFFKNFTPIANIKMYYYCPKCLDLLPHTESMQQLRCEACDKSYLISTLKRNGHYFVYIPIKPQLINKLSSPLYHCLKREPEEENILSDVTSGSVHTTLREKKVFSRNDISLQWNADGVQTFKSSKVSMCPVQVSVNELSYRLRKENILLAGMWAATDKPPINLYMKPFVEELTDLHENGFECLPPGCDEPILIKVHTILSPVDSVERCALQNIHQFNGEYGCSFCLNKGERVPVGNGFARVYPGGEGKKRTDIQLERHAVKAETENIVVKGVKGVSILLLLPIFSLIKSFPPEYMHCILLGVVKLFLLTWLDPRNYKSPWYLGTKIHLIDAKMCTMLPPTEISRTPQSLLNISQWKESEFKNFLQYYSLVVLKGVLPEDCYKHWLLLVYAINILNSDRITEEALEKATKALKNFVSGIPGLYGVELMKFNIHLLLHIPESVRRFGALWAWSAFPYEGYNFVLRNMLHGSQAILQQICKSYLRFQSIKLDDTLLQPNCSKEAKALYLKMMENYRQRTGKKTMCDDRLVLFGVGTVIQLNQYQTACIEAIVREGVEELSVRYDRFIFKNTLHHSSDYTKMYKRDNSIISTINGWFIQISGIFCVMTLSKVKRYVILGTFLEPTDQTLCTNKEFSSNFFMTSVKKSNSIVGLLPIHIKKKCVLLPSNDDLFVMELVNSVETE